MTKSLQSVIADAIKDSDKSYFFEDYSVQSKAVLNAIKKSGYVIVPANPSEEMIEAGTKAISTGHVKPTEHVKNVYQTMLAVIGIKI